MSKLVLHSDQIEGRPEVDEALLRLLTSKKAKIGYIPSRSDSQRKYFQRTREWYAKFGITDLLYFDIDQEFDGAKIDELMVCDAIHLSGGNTYYFLDALQRKGLLSYLRTFVEKGGVLIGVSAGSIIMSKTIAVTQIDDDLGGDQNEVGLEDLTALGFVDFEFFPHFDKASVEIERRLKEYSQRVGSVIYACGDGDGIVIDGDNIQFFGNVKKIENGEIKNIPK